MLYQPVLTQVQCSTDYLYAAGSQLEGVHIFRAFPLFDLVSRRSDGSPQ